MMRIGELATRVGVNPKTIRFYEEKGLLPDPARLASGYRDYGSKDEARLQFIRTAQRLRLSLAEIGEILAFKERGERPCGYVRSVLARQAEELDQRIDDLVHLRDQLLALQAEVADLPVDEGGCYCGIIEHSRSMIEPARLSETGYYRASEHS